MRHVVRAVTAVRFALATRRDLLLEVLALRHHWIAYLADELRSEGNQHVSKCLAIVRYGQVSGLHPRARQAYNRLWGSLVPPYEFPSSESPAVGVQPDELLEGDE